MKSVWSYGSQQESFSSEPVGKGIFPKTSTGPTGYQPRGLPEAVRPDQITEAAAGIDWPTAIETGMKMPAYTLERPLALADTIAQGLGVIDQDKGILDPIAEGLRGLPIVGEHLDNLGKASGSALDITFSGVGAFFNSPWAAAIEANKGKADNEALSLTDEIMAALQGAGGGIGALLDPNRAITMGDLKSHLRERGWTDDAFRSIESGEKGIFDFGDQQISFGNTPQALRGVEDFATRMAFDPMNLIFAPGLVTKAAKLTAAGLSKMTSSSLRYTAKLTSVPALGVRAGAAALEAGETAGVTAPAFASYLTNLARGGKTIQTALQTKRAIPYAGKLGKTTPAGWYRRTAVATTAGQVAINTADRMTPQDSVVRDWLEPIYDAAAAMGERKPLSENQLFVISSLLFYPWRSSAEGLMQKGKDYRAGKRLFDVENKILDKMMAAADKPAWVTTRAQAKKALEEAFGSADNFHRWAQQILKTGYFEKLWLQNLGKAAPAYAAESLAEVGMLTPLWNQWFNHSIERALKYGELSGDDVAKGLERFQAGRGGVTPGVTSGVEYANFSWERAVQSWNEWEPIARRISTMFPDGAPIAAGVNQDAIIKEGIDFMLAMVDNATVDGMLRAGELMRITYTMPAIFQHQAAGNLARIMTRDGSNAQLVAKEVKEALALVRDDAIDMADYFAPQRSWEARAVAGEIKSRVTNRMWHSSGKMADDINPNLGNAEVTVMTQSRKNSIAAGFLPNAEYIEIARILRNDLGVAVLDSALPNAAQTAGLDVLSAVQVALLDRSSTKAATLSANTGIAMRFAENTPFDEMVAVAARGLEQSGAERAMVVLRGRDIIKARGLVANADEVTFVVPRLRNQAAQDAQWDELTKLFQQFDDRVVMNDTTGLIRVIIPKNAPKRIENVLAQAEKRLGAGTRDSVHIRDIVNRKVRKSDPAGTISLRDAQRQAAQNQKYHVMGGYLSRYNRLFARNRGINVAAEPGAGVGASAPARAGNPDRTAPGARPTRYERERRNGRIRERTEEHVVVGPDADKLVRHEWGQAIRASGLDVRINPGDRVFATADSANGALVKRDGELIVWRKRDSAGRLAPKPDDFDDVISAASEHATWAHVLDVRDKRGLSPIDHLAEHGWGPTAKSVNGEGDTIVWLVRDPSGQVVNIPSKRMHGVGGWQAMRDSIPTVRVQQGRAQAKAQMLDPEAAQRQLEAARQNTLLERLRALDEADAEVAAIEARLDAEATARAGKKAAADREAAEEARARIKGLPGATGTWTSKTDAEFYQKIETFMGAPKHVDGGRQLVHQNGVYAYYDDAGDVVAYVAPDKNGLIGSIEVLPSRQRQGIGQQVYDELQASGFDVVKGMGHSSLTDAGRANALRWLERHYPTAPASKKAAAGMGDDGVLRLSTKGAWAEDVVPLRPNDIGSWESLEVGLPKNGPSNGIIADNFDWQGSDRLRYTKYDADGNPVSSLSFRVEDGKAISPTIITKPSARRQGHAMELYERASQDGIDMLAGGRSQSPAGRALYEAFGRRQAAKAAPTAPVKGSYTPNEADLTAMAAVPGADVIGPYGRMFGMSEDFVQVGRGPTGPTIGKLHVSATPDDADQVLAVVSSVADDMGVAYKWVYKKGDLVPGNGFGAGDTQSGKFITLYPEDAQIGPLAKRLDDVLEAQGLAKDFPVVNEPQLVPGSRVFYRADGDQFRNLGTKATRPELEALLAEAKTPRVAQAAAPVKGAYRSSSKWRAAVAQRDELRRLTSTTAAKARKDVLLESEVRNPGNFTFVKNTEDELREFVPHLDESVDGNLAVFPPGEAEKIVALERELKSTGWQYTVKAVPRHAATPYYVKQGEAYVGMMQGRQLAHDVVDNVVLSKLSQAQHILFGPVYAKELRRAYQQELYNEALNLGATPREVNAFLKALEKRWEEATGPLGVKYRKSPSALSPKLINDIAYGRHTVDYWTGFNPKVLAKNPDFADMVQRASSRNFRELAKKYPAVDGQGNLGRLIEEWYGKQTGTALADVGKATRRGMYYLSFGYHILRFVLDPRWYAMNLYEADFLGMARYGMKVKGQRPLGLQQEISRMRGKPVTPKTFPQDPAIQKLGGQRGPILSIEESLMADSISSGWMDVRNLYGYIAKSSALERGRITKKMLQEAIDGGSPVIQDLRSLWGDNPAKWVDELEDQLYRIDTVGAREAILSEPVAQQMLASNAPATKAYQEFIEGLVRQHQKSYQDIVHTFHGNVNRANIERIFNSPLLYWPLSYQLKTGKWLIDIMTKSFAGSSSELLGSAVLYKLMANHNQAMENNAEYRKMFDEHPALWRAFGMFLPMTPFDPGVMLARWTRYAGSWTGAQLGLWDQDPSYPQDVFNFVQRGLSLGPVYSSSIIEDIIDEFNREK